MWQMDAAGYRSSQMDYLVLAVIKFRAILIIFVIYIYELNRFMTLILTTFLRLQ